MIDRNSESGEIFIPTGLSPSLYILIQLDRKLMLQKRESKIFYDTNII